MTALGDGAREHLLAFADDEHLIGQQHAEWIGVAPFLEEDLAFCSIAQDELGHAATLYELLAPSDVDGLAFGRRPDDYRSCHLVERPCPDWADALVRHWLYDVAEDLRWEALATSSIPAVAAVVARARQEEVYHRRHAVALVSRMLDDDIAGGRVEIAVAQLLPAADALWDPVAGEAEAVTSGAVGASSQELQRRWRGTVEATVGPIAWSTLDRPEQHGRTARSEYFAVLHDRINEVNALDPTARW